MNWKREFVRGLKDGLPIGLDMSRSLLPLAFWPFPEDFRFGSPA